MKKIFRNWMRESALIRFYLWKYRKFVFWGLATLILVDALEVIPPLLLKETVDTVTGSHQQYSLMTLALLYMGVVAIQAVCRFGWRMFIVRTSMLSGRDLRKSYSQHLHTLSQSFFDRHKIGELMSLATNDTEAIRMALGAGLIVLGDAIFYFISITTAMFLLSPKLALIAFIPLPIIPIIVYRNEREIHDRFKKVQAAFSDLSSFAQENIMGMRVVKAFANEDAQIGRFAQAGILYMKKSLRLARVQSGFDPLLDFTMSLGIVSLLAVGGPWVITGAVTLGTFVAFQRYLQKMIWPMAALGIAVTFYQRAVVSAKRFEEVLTEKTDTPDPTPIAARSQNLQASGIELKGLSFRYPGRENTVLDNIHLRVAQGTRVAVLGRVGSGKTTLLSLLPRLYPIERGMLWIDGIDVNDFRVSELRAKLGFVSQDLFLFSDTVTENLLVALGERLTPDFSRVEKALEISAMHAEVTALPQKFETLLGERGVNLSGGQKQRMTLARALLREPDILVLDDALSSVDVETEERILDGLRLRPKRATELIAAHRVSTVRSADEIVVLEAGKIFERGTHTQLLKNKKGIYSLFYQQQQAEQELQEYVGQLENRSET